MLRKSYAIVGIILILINMGAFTLTWGNPFLVFSSQAGIFGFVPIILALIVIGSGFIENKIVRLSLSIIAAILWLIISFIGFIGNPTDIF